MGCFPVDFQEVKRPLRTKSVKRPTKVGERPIKEGKRPIKAMVLVGISVGCLMGCFRAPPPWRKTAPLKRPIKRSMRMDPEIPKRKRKIMKTQPEKALFSGCVFFSGSNQGWGILQFFVFSSYLEEVCVACALCATPGRSQILEALGVSSMEPDRSKHHCRR